MREADSSPKLIRTLEESIACRHDGRDDTRLQERLKKLINNDSEVMLALKWAADQEREPLFLEMQKTRIDGLLEAVQRKDLTIAEGVKLYMELNVEIRRMTEAAKENLKD